MAESDYRAVYKQFFVEFAKTVSLDDQLPVKVAAYNLCENELTGEIVDWILQYLGQKRCPLGLLAPLTKLAITEIRQAIRQNPAACGYMRENNVYHSLRLMQFVITVKLNELCLRFSTPGLLETLPPPSPSLPTTSCAIKNTRRRMEDRHVVIEDFHLVFDVVDAGRATYYGVFDGHAGTDAAIYSVSHLHQFIAESTAYPDDPVRAMREAFLRTDELFLEKSRREDVRSGTTALCALLQHDRRMLYVGWVGDSQATLVNRGKPTQLVLPHKPERPDERKRIEDMGGCVMFWGTWRVNGQLAVSRAIGDLDYKPYVSADPDIQAIPLDDTQDFLILACDGLWDFITEQDAVVSVYETIRERPGDLEAVSQNLVQLSKSKGSLDNISVIVVFLTDPATLAALDVWPVLEPETMDAATFDTNPFQTNGNNNNNNNQPQTNGTADAAYQKSNLLLDLNTGAPGERYNKQGVTSPSATDLCFLTRPTNGKEDANDEDDDFGPETDVDAVDDVLLSPAIAAAKAAAAAMEVQDHLDGEFETDMEVQRQELTGFDPVGARREETPTPPADDVPGGRLHAPEVDNVAESGEDSEDEWNYYRVDPTDEPAAAATEPRAKTAQEIEDEETMSRLNPNAAEFIPSPTSAKPSMEEILSASPCKGSGAPMDNFTVPSSSEFRHEASLRPAEIDVVGNPFSETDSFFNSVPDFVNGKGEGAVQSESPYQMMEGGADFGDFPGQLNPFKAAEHLFDKSEVSSTKAEFGDDTTTSFVSESDQLLKPFDNDPLNASMVESDFQIDNEMNFASNTSTDLFGLDLTQDITPGNISTLSPQASSEPFPLPSAPEVSFVGEGMDYLVESEEQVVADFEPETQMLSPPLSPMPSEPVETTTMLEDITSGISTFTNEAADVMHFEQHTEQIVSSFPDIIQESSLFNEMQLQTDAFREAVPSVFNDMISPMRDNADIIEEFSSTQFEMSTPMQTAPVQEIVSSIDQFDDFFNGAPSREIVTEAVIEPLSQVETSDSGFMGFEEREVPLPAEVAIDATVSEASTPAVEDTPALEPVTPAAEDTSALLDDTSALLDDTALTQLDTTVIAASAAGITAGVAALAVGALASKDAAKKDVKKAEADKTKPSTKPAVGTRAPSKTPLKSTPTSPTKPLTNALPTAAPRSSSTPKKPATPAAPTRVASKTATSASRVSSAGTTTTASKVTASSTTQVRAKVGGVSAPLKSAAPSKPAPVKAATSVPPRPRPVSAVAAKTTPTTERKPALSNGDAKPAAKRPEPLTTKKLVPTTTSKPLARPATAPVTATKTMKASTVTRTTVTTVGSAAAKPAAKPSVNGVSKPKAATTASTLRAKPAEGVAPKSGLIDKQLKETANKQISRTVAAKTSTVTRTSTTGGPRKAPGTVTKTTTTTTTSNKPSGPIRRPPGTAVTKITTTKVVDAPGDGDQVVIVEEVITTITKDESPVVDNAHIEVIASTD